MLNWTEICNYADDTTLYYSIQDLQEVTEKDLKMILFNSVHGFQKIT